MEPRRSLQPGTMSMPELVEDLQDLRKVIRKKLRVGAGPKPPLRRRARYWRPSYLLGGYQYERFMKQERGF